MFQILRFKKIVMYFFALLLLSHTAAANCDDRFYVIWRDIGLPDAARLVSQYSGRSIRLTPEVHGTINLASIDPLSPDEIFIRFQKSLQEKGLTLLLVDGNKYQIEAAGSSPAKALDMPSTVSGQAASPTTGIPAQGPAETLSLSAKLADNRQEPIAKRQHVGAIFAFEQRAQTIASQLCAAGTEAIVLASNDPADKEFSVVLLYQDNKEDYQAMISAVNRAGLNNLISMPMPPAEFSGQEK